MKLGTLVSVVSIGCTTVLKVDTRFDHIIQKSAGKAFEGMKGNAYKMGVNAGHIVPGSLMHNSRDPVT
ncbi:unnamed protein product [Caretta caretta]